MFHIFCEFLLELYECFFSVAGVAAYGRSRDLPNGFLIGASTAAYQIEGAWNRDGKLQCNFIVLYYKLWIFFSAIPQIHFEN